jgi:hypothetical protein
MIPVIVIIAGERRAREQGGSHRDSQKKRYDRPFHVFPDLPAIRARAKARPRRTCEIVMISAVPGLASSSGGPFGAFPLLKTLPLGAGYGEACLASHVTLVIICFSCGLLPTFSFSRFAR